MLTYEVGGSCIVKIWFLLKSVHKGIIFFNDVIKYI